MGDRLLPHGLKSQLEDHLPVALGYTTKTERQDLIVKTPFYMEKKSSFKKCRTRNMREENLHGLGVLQFTQQLLLG